jgi:hypothetical protein
MAAGAPQESHVGGGRAAAARQPAALGRSRGGRGGRRSHYQARRVHVLELAQRGVRARQRAAQRLLGQALPG